MSRARHAVIVAATGLLTCAIAPAQDVPIKPAVAAPPVASSASTEQSEVPQVPGISGLLKGLNGGLTVSGLHDSVTGWATLSQLALEYSFNDRFAIDILSPIYMYRLAQSRAVNPKPNALLVPLRAELGDVIVGLHAQFQPAFANYEATVTVSAPTGDEPYGLSSGRATFDLTNHFERTFRKITPSLELGVGDNTALVNRLVTKDYSSLGPLAHFQIGFAVPLLFGSSFQASAYEQLPIGDQKIYQSVTRGKTTTLIVTGHAVTEDNGFTTSLDVPIDGHTTLSTYYNRSLRQHDDTVSIGITYVMRSAKQPSILSGADLIKPLQLPPDPVSVPPPQPE